MVNIVIEILERLKQIPGLGFLYKTQSELMARRAEMDTKARKVRNFKRDVEVGFKSAKEIPSVLKGSKKRA